MTFLCWLFWIIVVLAVVGLIFWYSKSRKQKKGGVITKTEDIGKTEEPKLEEPREPEITETPEAPEQTEEPKF